MKLLNQPAYIRYIIAKLSIFVLKLACKPFYGGFFEIENGLELVLELGHIFHKIFDKNFSFAILHKLARFHCQTVLISMLFSKIGFLFHAQEFDDVITLEYLKS